MEKFAHLYPLFILAWRKKLFFDFNQNLVYEVSLITNVYKDIDKYTYICILQKNIQEHT
jgi:hypothetical protein